MTPTPELSRPVRIDTLGEVPRMLSIEADEAERTALARRFGLLALDRLEADVALVSAAGAVRCDGRLSASVVQACVASGEPVPAMVEEPFALRFVAAEPGASDEEVELGADDLDVVTFDGAMVDAGEAVAQTLALALDPFPRAPQAEMALRDAGVLAEGETGPFAALKALRDRL